jgi:hypothetical protein
MKTSVTDGLVVKFARAVLEDEIALSENNYNNAKDAFLKIKTELEKTKDILATYERRYNLAIEFKDYLLDENHRLQVELKEFQEKTQKDSQDKLKLANRITAKQDKFIACFTIITALIVVLSTASYYFPILPEEILAPVIIKECPKQVARFYETWRGYGN